MAFGGKSLASFLYALLSSIDEEKSYEANVDLPGNDQDFGLKVSASIKPGLKVSVTLAGEPKAGTPKA